MPHKEVTWFISTDKQNLYRRNPNGTFVTYRPNPNGRSMRKLKYIPCVSAYSPTLNQITSLLASVDIERPNQVSLHSTATRPVQSNTDSRSVQDILRSWPNPDLWKHLKCDDDGWWIKTALIEETLIAVADGSYQEEIDPNVCSCAFKLLCFKTSKSLTCTWGEKTEEASNYRG